MHMAGAGQASCHPSWASFPPTHTRAWWTQGIRRVVDCLLHLLVLRF
jgi:hypothetical protein